MAQVQCSELPLELTGDAIVCEAAQELLLEGTGECGLQVSEEYIHGSFVDVMVALIVADECVYCVDGVICGAVHTIAGWWADCGVQRRSRVCRRGVFGRALGEHLLVQCLCRSQDGLDRGAGISHLYRRGA